MDNFIHSFILNKYYSSHYCSLIINLINFKVRRAFVPPHIDDIFNNSVKISRSVKIKYGTIRVKIDLYRLVRLYR